MPCYVLSWRWTSVKTDPVQACDYLRALLPFYQGVMVTDFFYASVTCYFNIKFSQNLSDANREFFLVFNTDQKRAHEAVLESEEREKARRLHEF